MNWGYSKLCSTTISLCSVVVGIGIGLRDSGFNIPLLLDCPIHQIKRTFVVAANECFAEFLINANNELIVNQTRNFTNTRVLYTNNEVGHSLDIFFFAQ